LATGREGNTEIQNQIFQNANSSKRPDFKMSKLQNAQIAKRQDSEIGSRCLLRNTKIKDFQLTI